MGAPGRLWEALGAPGSAWERLGAPGSALERLGAPGSAWERLGALGSVWERLGAPESTRERLGAPGRLGASGSAWERFGAPGSAWERWGAPGSAWSVWERLGAPGRLATSGSAWERFGAPGCAWERRGAPRNNWERLRPLNPRVASPLHRPSRVAPQCEGYGLGIRVLEATSDPVRLAQPLHAISPPLGGVPATHRDSRKYALFFKSRRRARGPHRRCSGFPEDFARLCRRRWLSSSSSFRDQYRRRHRYRRRFEINMSWVMGGWDTSNRLRVGASGALTLNPKPEP